VVGPQSSSDAEGASERRVAWRPEAALRLSWVVFLSLVRGLALFLDD
jgi:hypothetical protein